MQVTGNAPSGWDPFLRGAVSDVARGHGRRAGAQVGVLASIPMLCVAGILAALVQVAVAGSLLGDDPQAAIGVGLVTGVAALITAAICGALWAGHDGRWGVSMRPARSVLAMAVLADVLGAYVLWAAIGVVSVASHGGPVDVTEGIYTVAFVATIGVLLLGLPVLIATIPSAVIWRQLMRRTLEMAAAEGPSRPCRPVR